MAHDEWRDDLDEFAATRADLVDPAKRRVGDQEVTGLLEQFEGHGASGEQSKGRGFNLDAYRRFLRGKGISEDDIRGMSVDDIRQACDALGINKSAKFGGNFGGGMGGNLSEQISQPNTRPTDPGAKDRDFPIDGEARGECAYAGDGPHLIGGHDSFEALCVSQDRVQQIREATRSRRPRTANQIAMDAQAQAQHEARRNAMFPGAARIRYYI
jgi:hypothetical protein